MSSLGRAIIKDRFKGTRRQDSSWLHTTDLDDDVGKINLKSITEESTLEEFLHYAELSDRQFTAERMNVKLVTTNSSILPSKEEELKLKETHEKFRQQLTVPRRPAWDSTTTPEALDQQERQMFLDWRRSLALLAENEGVLLTPYEKNLEVWRQLWRVIEKSDAVVQIVDARNPLFFRCKDLELYVQEVDKGKQNILLLNKADFLTLEQRKVWAKYFDEQGLTAIFWSATAELERMKTAVVEDDSEDMREEEIEDDKDDEKNNEENNGKNSPRVLDTDELMEVFRSFPLKTSNKTGIRTFGLVGYPNVGKSSTLNALLTRKEQLAALNDEKTKHVLAPVSATPGKTKHFQTFFLEEKSLMLCDCPGLVMPTFVSTKAEMVTSGVLPIDQLTDCIAPTTIVCNHIPRNVLESMYGIMLPISTDEVYPDRNPTAYELLTAYARIRGFMSHKGVPDTQRASRLILKDYVNGKLCYCYAPPGIDEETYGSKPRPKTEKASHKSENGTAHRIVISHDPCLSEQVASSGTRGAFKRGGIPPPMTVGGAGRPLKHHGNKGKKQKLRITFSHLDA